ncbi:hypothetical protein [Brevibacillus sp. SIMBA_040]|uniref:hypothetical protein n=1 Tax=unclassified Brevibacillus TaxID=2684853 RepID=UPI00397C3BDD
MTNIVQFKDRNFFLEPTKLDKHDMNFEIYSQFGELIGTTIYGIQKDDLFSSEKEQDDFMNFLDIEAHKIEAGLKFAHEFGIPVEQANTLNLSSVKIIDIMGSKWSIPVEIMDEVLDTYLS